MLKRRVLKVSNSTWVLSFSPVNLELFLIRSVFYEIIVISSLLDINECRESSDLCKNGVCRNLAGTYICDCDSGYVRSADGKECEGKQKHSVIFFKPRD